MELTYSGWFLPCSELGGLLSEFELAATELAKAPFKEKKNGIGRGVADHLESGRTNAHRQSIVEVLYRFGFPISHLATKLKKKQSKDVYLRSPYHKVYLLLDPPEVDWKR